MRKVLNTFRKPEKIADVNFCGKNGLSALHVAVKAGQFESMSILIQAGANLNEETCDGLQQ